jgi:hypothetical protein
VEQTFFFSFSPEGDTGAAAAAVEGAGEAEEEEPPALDAAAGAGEEAGALSFFSSLPRPSILSCSALQQAIHSFISLFDSAIKR